MTSSLNGVRHVESEPPYLRSVTMTSSERMMRICYVSCLICQQYVTRSREVVLTSTTKHQPTAKVVLPRAQKTISPLQPLNAALTSVRAAIDPIQSASRYPDTKSGSLPRLRRRMTLRQMTSAIILSRTERGAAKIRTTLCRLVTPVIRLDLVRYSRDSEVQE